LQSLQTFAGGVINGRQGTAREWTARVTALERAFQLARSGQTATTEDIKKRLKREGYNERVVTDGGNQSAERLFHQPIVRPIIAAKGPVSTLSLTAVCPAGAAINGGQPRARKPQHRDVGIIQRRIAELPLI
jgi:hypothetical protein